jgi:hypothetical protein
VKVALIVVGAVLLLIIGGVAWLASLPESGVKLPNQMDKYALDYLEAHHVLQPSEKLIAYYDVSTKMDSSEASLLTNQRIVYLKEGRVTAMAVADIESVDQIQEGLSYLITVHSKSGESMLIDIARMNGGEVFYKELMAAKKRAAAH